MRILFNHGMTAEELYSNTPKRVIDRKWRWFIKYYGPTRSYEDAISDPFKYCFGLVLNKILDERVRFIIPAVSESYIDFEIVDGDDFIKQRQNGRFPDIDFVESDFKGYGLRYFFKAKSYQKSYPVYIGSQLKQKFIDGTNSGIKYYTTRDVTMYDFIDEVHLKFQELTRQEVKSLLLHGFRRLHSAMKFGCAITINTTKFVNCYAYIGDLSLNPEKQIREYSIRRDRKLRKIEGWKKTPFDGYYYIGINPTALDTWIEENKKSRTLVKFKNVILRKIQQELYYKYKTVHVFRIKLTKFHGWAFWADEVTSRNITYMGVAYNHTFTPSNETWKELLKKYEKR